MKDLPQNSVCHTFARTQLLRDSESFWHSLQSLCFLYQEGQMGLRHRRIKISTQTDIQFMVSDLSPASLAAYNEANQSLDHGWTYKFHVCKQRIVQVKSLKTRHSVGNFTFKTCHLARHEGVCGSGGVAPLIRNVGTRFDWVVTFTELPLSLLGKNFATHGTGCWLIPRFPLVML